MVWVKAWESPRMPKRDAIAADGHGGTGSGHAIATRTVHGLKLPREGATAGGGEVNVFDRGLLAKTLDSTETWGRPKSNGLRVSNSTGTLSTTATSNNGTARSLFDGVAAATWHPGSRKRSHEQGKGWMRANVLAKQEMLDAMRMEDQKRITENVEAGKKRREERFARLLDEVTRTHPICETSFAIRKHEVHEDKRKRDLHAAWDARVGKPLEGQLHDYMNPPNRAREQALSGIKSVGFQDRTPIASVQMREDPTWTELASNAWEDSFDREATAVLHGLRSPTRLRATSMPDSGKGLRPPSPKSRTVLEPTDWGQLRFQSTPFGRFAQVVEQGPDVRMGKKAANAIFPPDESDGVPVAGKRTMRVGVRSVRHNDSGMLRGDGAAWNGEASLSKTWHGASSAAPVQDHYLFETGSRVTDAEFPLGKRMVPHFP